MSYEHSENRAWKSKPGGDTGREGTLRGMGGGVKAQKWCRFHESVGNLDTIERALHRLLPKDSTRREMKRECLLSLWSTGCKEG